jgi:hypothetical protein
VLLFLSTGWSLPGFPFVRLFHRRGNAVVHADLCPLLELQGNVGEVIVLGDQEYVELSPTSKDTRVLAILLLLKHATKHWHKAKHTIHAIAENLLDQSATIAVVPDGNLFQPDFVNTQAFTARALVMALAYPDIQPAIKELFDDIDHGDSNHNHNNHDDDDDNDNDDGKRYRGGNGTPEFNLVPVPLLGFVGKVIAFGLVQRIVSAKFQGWAIAIGLMAVDGTLELAPGIAACRQWVRKREREEK